MLMNRRHGKKTRSYTANDAQDASRTRRAFVRELRKQNQVARYLGLRGHPSGRHQTHREEELAEMAWQHQRIAEYINIDIKQCDVSVFFKDSHSSAESTVYGDLMMR